MFGIIVGLLSLQACGIGGGADGESGGAADGAPDAPEASLLVFAASDLQAVFEELVPLYERRAQERVEIVLGSTGMLATQIRQGAPADVFFAADEAFMDALIEEGAIDPGSRRVYALGRLALVAPPGAAAPPSVQALEDPSYEVVAIANPEHAPYGIAARESLRSAGAWPEVADRLVFGENVVQAYQFVRTGNADAGIVALGLIEGAPGTPVPYTLVPDSLHAPLRQAAGVSSGGQRAERASDFLDFVLSPPGREALARHGFMLPEGASPGVRP